MYRGITHTINSGHRNQSIGFHISTYMQRITSQKKLLTFTERESIVCTVLLSHTQYNSAIFAERMDSMITGTTSSMLEKETITFKTQTSLVVHNRQIIRISLYIITNPASAVSTNGMLMLRICFVLLFIVSRDGI